MKKGNESTIARIQGQGQERMKVGNSTILDHFQTISSLFILGAGKWPRILKLGGKIFEIRHRFSSRDLWTLVLTTSDKLFS